MRCRSAHRSPDARTRGDARGGTGVRARDRRRRRRRDRRSPAGRSPRDEPGSGAYDPVSSLTSSSVCARSASTHLEPRDRVARRRRVQRVARAIAPVTPERGLDPTRQRGRSTANERRVRPLDLALADHLLEQARTHQTTVRRSGARTCPGRADGRSPADRRRHRPRRRARGGPGRACPSAWSPPDGRRGRRACRRRAGGRPPRRSGCPATRSQRLDLGDLGGDLLSPFESEALGPGFAVDEHEPAGDQALGKRARRELAARAARTRSSRAPACSSGT